MQAALLVLPHFVAVMAQTFTTQTIAQWEVGGIDYMWDAEHTKASYIKDGQFILNNNYVAGVKVYGDQVFVTVPRWFSGVPSTLNYFKFVKGAGEFFTMKNPTLIPFPSWEGNAISGGGSSSGSSSHTKVATVYNMFNLWKLIVLALCGSLMLGVLTFLILRE